MSASNSRYQPLTSAPPSRAESVVSDATDDDDDERSINSVSSSRSGTAASFASPFLGGVAAAVPSVHLNSSSISSSKLDNIPIMAQLPESAPLQSRRERARRVFDMIQQRSDSSSRYSLNNKSNKTILRSLVGDDPDLLWVPVSCGKTCMHVAAQYWTLQQYNIGTSASVDTPLLRFLTQSSNQRTAIATLLHQQHTSGANSTFIESRRMIELSRVALVSGNNKAQNNTDIHNDWAWIIQQATQQSSSKNRAKVARQRDTGGDTVLDTFWQTWVDPCGVPLFGSSNNDTRASAIPSFVEPFSDALAQVLDDSKQLDRVKILVEQHEKAKNVGESYVMDDSVLDAVYLVVRFWLACKELLDAAKEDNQSTLTYLAKTGSCPEGLARLSIGILAHDEMPNVNNCLDDIPETLLHHWAKALKPIHQERDGMLVPLLDKCSKMALVKDKDGRLPLHYALHYGKPMRQIAILWQRVPATLHIPDPCKGLCVVALITLAARKEKMHVLNALDRRNPSVSLHDWLDARRDGTERVRQEMNVQLVDSIFKVLRAYPQVLQ